MAEGRLRCGLLILLLIAMRLRLPITTFQDNLYEWHFTVRGPPETVSKNDYRVPLTSVRHVHALLFNLATGLCGRSVPWSYPFAGRVSVQTTTHYHVDGMRHAACSGVRDTTFLLSEITSKHPVRHQPNGRFEVGKKICLTITGYHPEFWQPAWGIRTALMAIISFFPTRAEGAVGGIDWSPEERKALVKRYVRCESRACTCIALSFDPGRTMDSFDKDPVRGRVLLVRQVTTTLSQRQQQQQKQRQQR